MHITNNINKKRINLLNCLLLIVNRKQPNFVVLHNYILDAALLYTIMAVL
jgi:hypothetical protein